MPIQQIFFGVPEKTYIDDIFSTYLFTGNNATQQITNGINLSGEGGLVWSKLRNGGSGDNHRLTDTVRGVNKSLSSDGNFAEYTTSGVQGVTQFTSSGFYSGLSDIFYNNDDISSWSFRKEKGFFDICEWDGDNQDGRVIPHNLGCRPGLVAVKRTDTTSNWIVVHYDHANTTLRTFWLNTTAGGDTTTNALAYHGGYVDTLATASFTLQQHLTEPLTNVNATGGSYIAYVFAGTNESDSKIFGEGGDTNIIHAGSYTGDGGAGTTGITLGWEPQWILVKRYDAADNWVILDSMRGIATKDTVQNDAALLPNAGDVETNASYLELTPTGFKTTTTVNVNVSGDKYAYLAIRRPDSKVGKPPVVGTDVFSMVTGVASDTNPAFASGFPVDMGMYRKPGSTDSWKLDLRLMGQKQIYPNTANAENNGSTQWDNNSRFGPLDASQYNSDYQAWFWKRYSGFTTVCYTGDGSSDRQISHDMNNDIEMMWIKNRELGTGGSSRNWVVYHKGLNGGTNPAHYYVPLNHDFIQINEDTIFNDTEPTSTNFTVGSNDLVNTNNISYAAMLFGSVDGISKVGYFDGSASTISITVGFQPRFLIVRRITGSADADWHVFDTLRGWGTSSAYNLHLNGSDNHHNQGNISTLTSTGFTLTNNAQWNNNGEKYIYYTHA